MNNFLAANLDPIEWGQKAELLARKAKAVKVGRAIRNDKAAQDAGRKLSSSPLVSNLTNFTLTEQQWDAVSAKAKDLGVGVKVGDDTVKGNYQGFNEPVIKIAEMVVTGDADKVHELTGWMTALSEKNPVDVGLGSGVISVVAWQGLREVAAVNNVVIGCSSVTTGRAVGSDIMMVQLSDLKLLGTLANIARVRNFFDLVSKKK